MATREKLLQQIYDNVSLSNKLFTEYNSTPKKYGEVELTAVENDIIYCIAQQPGITVTELSVILYRTPSACSQIVRKLRGKNWVEQIRNQKNNREYNLYLTEYGMQIHRAHMAHITDGWQLVCSFLSEFTDEELALTIRVQNKLNEGHMAKLQPSR
jgi:DNA-binding MarR family transcriptional regulator